MSDTPSTEWNWREDLEAFARMIGIGVATHEVRVILPRDGHAASVVAGCFDNVERLALAIQPWRQVAHCYVTLNPLRVATGRTANLLERQSTHARDEDIARREWLLIDIDPRRPKGMSAYCATAEEHTSAIALRDRIAVDLEHAIGAQCARLDSGNGATLLYRLGAQPVSSEDMKRALAGMAVRYDNGEAIIDRSVHNLGRLTRIAGTINAKQTSAERPRRFARFDGYVDDLEPVAFAKLLSHVAVTHSPLSPHDHSTLGKHDTVHEGERHNALMKRAGALRRVGAHESEILVALAAMNIAACQPPLNENEVASIARAAGRYDIAEARVRDRPNIIAISDVEEVPLQWLWQRYLPMGKLVVLDGDPNRGKSFLTLDIAARISRGDAMPDGTAGLLGDVMIVSCEDSVEDTIRPRLRAARANLSRVHMFRGFGEKPGEHLFELGSTHDLVALESALTERGIRLLIFDPLVAFFGGQINVHRDQDVRRALAPLAAMAQRTGVVVLAIRHLNKMAGPSAMYRGGGSIAIIAAARSAYLIAVDPDDPDLRVFAQVKTNLAERATSLAFRLESTDEGLPFVKWEGPSRRTADELVGTDALPRSRPEQEAAEAFLCGALASGPVDATLLADRSAEMGIASATLRRAKKSLGVGSYRRGAGWVWALTEPQGAHDPRDEHVGGQTALEYGENPSGCNDLQVARKGDHAKNGEHRVITLDGGASEVRP